MKHLQGTPLGLRGLIGFFSLMVCFVTPSQACASPPSCGLQAALPAERESAPSAFGLYSLHSHFVALKHRLSQARPVGQQHHAASERTGWGGSHYRLEWIAQEPRPQALPVVTRGP